MLAAPKFAAAARPARLLAGLALACLLGCVHQQTPPTPPAAASVPPGTEPGAPPSPPAVTQAPPGPAASASPAPGPATQLPQAPGPPPRATAGTATASATAPSRPVPAAAPAAPTAGTPGRAAGAGSAPAPSTAPAPAASPAPAALDLAALEQRLRDTHAIGLFTKLSLKNQVDDLLAQFRAFYAGQGRSTLEGLRHSYELLLMKVVTLLQDDDPGLAGAVSSSREAIWAILSNRNKFNNL